MGYSGLFLSKRLENMVCPGAYCGRQLTLAKPGDKGLLREMGVDECLKKPFDKSTFYSTIIWALQQHKFPSEEKSFLEKLDDYSPQTN